MTVTEAPRDVHVADATDTEPAPATGLAALVGSGDPRTVGKLFVGTSLLLLVAVAVIGFLVGLDQVDLGGAMLDAFVFQQLVTLHELGGLLLVAMPFFLGLALAVVPLQVGASTLAFPRACAAAYWTFLVSVGILVAGYVADGGPFGGDIDGVGLFVVALLGVLASLATVIVSVMSTVLAMRAPGMSLRRVPLFAWSMVVAGAVWLLTLAVLAAMLVLFHFDFNYGGATLFPGGSTQLYDLLRWITWQPAVYAVAIPALGVIGDVVPVFAQRRHVQHRVAMVLIGLFGALSFGAWAQVAWFSEGIGEAGEPLPVEPDAVPWLYEGPWIAASVVAVVPVLGLLGLWALTLGAGRVKLQGPLLLALGAGALLALGVVGGVGTAVSSLDAFGTTWVTGQGYAVLVGSVTAALAGLVFWAPKLYGRRLAEGVARLVAPLLVVGGLLLAVPYAIAGVLNQAWWVPSEVALQGGIDEVDVVETLNLVAVVGMGIVVLVGALAGAGALRAARGGTVGTADDPWGGHTLEWATSSPPPVGNFETLPEITSEAPVYDRRHAEAAGETEEVSA